jgi:hypothetical protein
MYRNLVGSIYMYGRQLGTKLLSFMKYCLACIKDNWGQKCELLWTIFLPSTYTVSGGWIHEPYTVPIILGRGTFPLELEPLWSWSYGSWIYNYFFSVYIILPENTHQYLFTAADNSPWKIFHSRFAIFRRHFWKFELKLLSILPLIYPNGIVLIRI